MTDASRETRAVHAGTADPVTGAVAPSIQPSTTFLRDGNAALVGPVDYRRPRGPGEIDLEAVLSELDGGAGSRLFGSGLAAISAVIDTLPAGAHVVAQTHMYYGAKKLMQRAADASRIALTLFDPGEDGALEAAVRNGESALVWIETPANPMWTVVDIEAAAKTAHAAGARLAVDSTCAPPCTTQPLALGADLVMHSATKYLNGHSDVLAGVLTTAKADAAWTAICEAHSLTGATPGALETFLLTRGLRTLWLRYERQSANALHLATALQTHSAVAAVLYPGLETHPGHAIATRQMTGGYGGMLSVRLKGGSGAAKAFATSTELFAQATSLGGVESLIEHRKPIEGPQSPTPDDLVRVSVGIERVEDLERDLIAALDRL